MASAGANRDIAKSRLDMGSGSGDAASKVHGWMSWTLAPRVTLAGWCVGVSKERGGCGGFGVAAFWPGDRRSGRPPSSTCAGLRQEKLPARTGEMRLADDEI